MTCASETGVKSMGWEERDVILIWIDRLALDWDCGLADCGTYFLCRCGLSGQNEILFIALTCFFSKLVSHSSLKVSRIFFYHLQPLPSPSSSRGTPNGMAICCVSLRNIVTSWCNIGCNLHRCQRYKQAWSFWMTKIKIYLFQDAHFCPLTTQIMIPPSLTVTSSHTRYSISWWTYFMTIDYLSIVLWHQSLLKISLLFTFPKSTCYLTCEHIPPNSVWLMWTLLLP